MNNKQSYLYTFTRIILATLVQIVAISICHILDMIHLMPPAGVGVDIFCSLAMLLHKDADAVSWATNQTNEYQRKKLSFTDSFEWDNIKDAMPGYILTFSIQIAVAYVALAYGFPLIPPTIFAFSAANLATLIGMPLSALLCASINKCVKLYTGNNDRVTIHAPLKLHYNFKSYTYATDGNSLIPTRDELLGKDLTDETSNPTQDVTVTPPSVAIHL